MADSIKNENPCPYCHKHQEVMTKVLKKNKRPAIILLDGCTYELKSFIVRYYWSDSAKSSSDPVDASMRAMASRVGNYDFLKQGLLPDVASQVIYICSVDRGFVEMTVKVFQYQLLDGCKTE